jgi:2-succinyl-6-hydroxy-2,4-cyclohexadiene-1-carboxylate synthase
MRLRMIHGFTQTSRSWGAVEARLPYDWDIQAIEVPDGLDFATTAEAAGLRGGIGVWIGYSMGARLALRLALDRPDLVERLVLISGTAGIEDAGQREARQSSDEALAVEVERDGVAPFLDRWLNQRLFETLPRAAAMVDDRRKGNTVHRIAHQLRVLGQGAQEPLWTRLAELTIPVLLVTGAYDRTYTEIAQRLAGTIRHAQVATIPKAGHAVHLERPDEVAEALVTWLGDPPAADDSAGESSR